MPSAVRARRPMVVRISGNAPWPRASSSDPEQRPAVRGERQPQVGGGREGGQPEHQRAQRTQPPGQRRHQQRHRHAERGHPGEQQPGRLRAVAGVPEELGQPAHDRVPAERLRPEVDRHRPAEPGPAGPDPGRRGGGRRRRRGRGPSGGAGPQRQRHPREYGHRGQRRPRRPSPARHEPKACATGTAEAAATVVPTVSAIVYAPVTSPVRCGKCCLTSIGSRMFATAMPASASALVSTKTSRRVGDAPAAPDRRRGRAWRPPAPGPAATGGPATG